MKKEKLKQNPVCEPCESNFQENIQELVDNVENYSKKEQNAKRREVNAAFGGEKNTTTSRKSTTAKSTAGKKMTTKATTAKKPAAKKTGTVGAKATTTKKTTAKTSTKKTTTKKGEATGKIVQVDIIEIYKD